MALPSQLSRPHSLKSG